MTIRELINELLDSPMDTEIRLYLEGKHTDEYGVEYSGWLFPIDSIEDGTRIKFTDWRAKADRAERRRVMADMCGDNRFKIIARAKKDLLEGTNIDTSEDEMKVLDDFLFRCWQMGWLDRYTETKEERVLKIEVGKLYEDKGNYRFKILAINEGNCFVKWLDEDGTHGVLNEEMIAETCKPFKQTDCAWK